MAIQAALQVGYDGKMRSYREAIAAGVKITPLIISTGCTLHSEFRKTLKAIIPDGYFNIYGTGPCAVVLQCIGRHVNNCTVVSVHYIPYTVHTTTIIVVCSTIYLVYYASILG